MGKLRVVFEPSRVPRLVPGLVPESGKGSGPIQPEGESREDALYPVRRRAEAICDTGVHVSSMQPPDDAPAADLMSDTSRGGHRSAP